MTIPVGMSGIGPVISRHPQARYAIAAQPESKPPDSSPRHRILPPADIPPGPDNPPPPNPQRVRHQVPQAMPWKPSTGTNRGPKVYPEYRTIRPGLQPSDILGRTVPGRCPGLPSAAPLGLRKGWLCTPLVGKRHGARFQLRNSATPPPGVAELRSWKVPPKNRPLRSAPAEPDRSPPTPEPAHCRARLAKTMPPIQYRQDGTTKPVPPRRYRQASAISASRCITVCCRCELRLVGEIQVSRARECSGLVSTQQQSCFPKTRPPRTGNR